MSKNIYQVLAIVLSVLGIILGIIIGAIGFTNLNTLEVEFNVWGMLLTWLSTFLYVLLLFGIGHILSEIQSNTKKVKFNNSKEIWYCPECNKSHSWTIKSCDCGFKR